MALYGTVWRWSRHSTVPLSGGVLEISLVQDPGPICQRERDAPTERKCRAQAGEPSAPLWRYPGTSMEERSSGSGPHNTLLITHTVAIVVVTLLLHLEKVVNRCLHCGYLIVVLSIACGNFLQLVCQWCILYLAEYFSFLFTDLHSDTSVRRSS